jgi:hypothetical protein
VIRQDDPKASGTRRGGLLDHDHHS